MSRDNDTVATLGEDLVPLTMRTLRPADSDAQVVASLEDGLVVGERLGEGGMGVVLAAEQRSLGRSVAVKRTRVPAASLRARLVREAIVTGALAHPNVIPVHDLRRDADGAPLLVMQRVEGRPWSTFLDDGPPASGARDPLAWHAGVLVQVCHAVEFAHSRGVLHRDLKPQNVMIGRYGEVYVLDWGLALALPGCELPGLDAAADNASVAGTPAYMAPEQARGAPLDATTDVWLLGAMAYELLHHRPLHRSETESSGTTALREVLAIAARGQVDRPPCPAPEFAEVLDRALCPEKGGRFPTAQAFREAFTWAVDRREARSALDEGRGHLESLRAALGGDDGQAVALAAAAARSAARRVLAAWPGDAEATALWREATDRAGDWHLRHLEPAAAELLFADDPDVPAAAREALAAAREVLAARNRRLAHADDRVSGVRTRSVVLTVSAFVWLGGQVGAQWLPQTRAVWFCMSGGMVALGVFFAVWARDSLSKSAVNQMVQALIVLAPLVHLVAQLGAWVGGHDVGFANAMSLLGYAGMAVGGALLIGWKALPSFVGYAGAFAVAMRHPEWTAYAYTVANGLFAVNMLALFGGDATAMLHRDFEEIRSRFRRS